MHIDWLIALGVGVHLLATLAKAIWKSPQRQAQADAIEQKIDDILAALQAAKGAMK